MFEVGFWELVLVFGVGLVVLGPERLPRVAAQLGNWAGQARRMARNLSSQIQAEIQPVESSLHSVNESLRKDYSAMRPEPGQSVRPAEQTAAADDVTTTSKPEANSGIDTQA